MLVLLGACRSQQSDGDGAENTASGAPTPLAAPEAIIPPFPVRDELEGLLMVWYDDKGTHTASKRSEIPEGQRAQVRIDALDLAPDARQDPDRVYVADLRAPTKDGSYSVQRATRAWFDAQVDRAKPAPAAPVADDAAGPIVIYKASWCGVCKSAASFLRSRHVEFVEKDVEKEPGANAEMLRKAHAKGLNPRGVPVIDFRGEILLGFDRAHMQALLDRKPI